LVVTVLMASLTSLRPQWSPCPGRGRAIWGQLPDRRRLVMTGFVSLGNSVAVPECEETTVARYVTVASVSGTPSNGRFDALHEEAAHHLHHARRRRGDATLGFGGSGLGSRVLPIAPARVVMCRQRVAMCRHTFG
jgi:hypothetical protein